jgi:hypothetical protein
VKSLFMSMSTLVFASALAQVVPKEFPAEGAIAPAAALKDRFAGKIYLATLADGTRWRIDYKANGYFFVNTSTGFNGAGDWHTDEGKLCSRLRGNPPGCNDVRLLGDVMYLKRDSGEVIAMTPQ